MFKTLHFTLRFLCSKSNYKDEELLYMRTLVINYSSDANDLSTFIRLKKVVYKKIVQVMDSAVVWNK